MGHPLFDRRGRFVVLRRQQRVRRQVEVVGDVARRQNEIQRMVSARKAQRGFTLIELLIVVTIIGILAGIAVVNVKNAKRKASENVLKANLALMRKGIDDYYADKQKYPASLQELV